MRIWTLVIMCTTTFPHHRYPPTGLQDTKAYGPHTQHNTRHTLDATMKWMGWQRWWQASHSRTGFIARSPPPLYCPM